MPSELWFIVAFFCEMQVAGFPVKGDYEQYFSRDLWSTCLTCRLTSATYPLAGRFHFLVLSICIKLYTHIEVSTQGRSLVGKQLGLGKQYGF